MDHRAITQGVIVRIAVSVFGFATLAMLLLAVFNDQGYFGVRAQKLKLRAVEKDIDTLQKDIEATKEESKKLYEADPEVIEKHAREDLGLVKPGDVNINLTDDSAADPAPANNN